MSVFVCGKIRGACKHVVKRDAAVIHSRSDGFGSEAVGVPPF